MNGLAENARNDFGRSVGVDTSPIVQEVFQGLRETPATAEFRRDFSAIPRLTDPLPEVLFVEGAEIYRLGRRKGLTIRSSIDCLIAAIAIANAVPVWHHDRDFRAIGLYTGLRTIEFPDG